MKVTVLLPWPHQRQPTRPGPVRSALSLPVQCSAIPLSLTDSELESSAELSFLALCWLLLCCGLPSLGGPIASGVDCNALRLHDMYVRMQGPQSLSTQAKPGWQSAPQCSCMVPWKYADMQHRQVLNSVRQTVAHCDQWSPWPWGLAGSGLPATCELPGRQISAGDHDCWAGHVLEGPWLAASCVSERDSLLWSQLSWNVHVKWGLLSKLHSPSSLAQCTTLSDHHTDAGWGRLGVSVLPTTPWVATEADPWIALPRWPKHQTYYVARALPQTPALAVQPHLEGAFKSMRCEHPHCPRFAHPGLFFWCEDSEPSLQKFSDTPTDSIGGRCRFCR